MADFVIKFLVGDLDIIDGSKRVEVKVTVAQSCLTLCDTMDYTVHGILQTRILQTPQSLLPGTSCPRN